MYRAWDLNLDSPRAIKENLDTSPQAQRQFKREAQILDKLVHPNLPRVIDHFVIPNQGQYLVMDFVEGQDLGEMLRNGPLPEARVLPWIIQVCDALSYLHSQNPPVIHRDVKPGNIKITPQGKAMLVDFGISKVYDPTLSTTVGARAVTPGYSPPEQYGKGVTDVRSDLYALGATLYHLLTGQLPPDSVDVLTHVAPPPPPALDLNAAISQALSSAVAKAMALDREARWANADEFKNAITIRPSTGGVRGDTAIPPMQVAPTPPSKQPFPSPKGMRIPTRKVSWGLLGAVGALVLVVVILATLLIGSVLSNGKGTPAVVSAIWTPPTTEAPIFTTTHASSGEPPSNPSAGDIWVSPKDGMTMVFIPAGDFLMGSTDSDKDASSDEKPQHMVYLDSFWIALTEVTNQMFEKFVQETGYQTAAEKEGSSLVLNTSSGSWEDTPGADWRHPQGPTSSLSGKEDHPVVRVSWEDVVVYCEWAGGRLPSEAEWEKAARGEDGRLYPWGDRDVAGNSLNFADVNLNVDWADKNIDDGYQFTAPVGSYLMGASPYGILDMAGNVDEWGMDWYSESYYANSPAQNPPGPSTGDHCVIRGSSWLREAIDVRIAHRGWGNPGVHVEYIGFRCARSP